MTRVLSVVMVAALLGGAGTASADATTIGSLNLPAGGTAQICNQGCTVVQGQVAPASAGSYVLRAPTDGTITAWSYRSANAGQGSSYALRVLRPTDASETAFTAVTTTASQTVPDNTDSVQGPFPASVPVKAGDRIGLQATGPNDPGVPIFTTGQNDPATGDGIRWFQSLADGASGAPTSPGNNGQQVLVQATVQSAPPPRPLPPQLFTLGITRDEFRGVPDARGQSVRNHQIFISAKVVNSGAYKKRRWGTLIRYWISEDATVTFTVEKFAGCGRQPRVRLCSFRQYGRSFSRKGVAGHNGVGWLGRVVRVFHFVSSRLPLPLEPGSYRLDAVASNANGQSRSKHVDFTIIP